MIIEKKEKKKEKVLGDTNLSSKPATEQELFILQLLHTTTRNEEVWNTFFSLISSYTRSILLKINKGKKYLDPEVITDDVNWAVIQFIERYKDPNFRVVLSFGGTLKWPCVSALWGNKKEDVHYSLNKIVDATNKELGESQESLDFTSITAGTAVSPEDEALKVEYFEEMKRMLNEYDKAIKYNGKLMILCRCKIVITLQKSKSRHIKELFDKYFIKDRRESILLDTVLLEMKNRLKALTY